MSKSPKFAYVLTEEHYHFPPNDSSMVAATAKYATLDKPGSADAMKVKAYQFANHQKNRNSKVEGDIVIREYIGTGVDGGLMEYRVWCDVDEDVYPHFDKFVWIVRRVELI